MNCILGDIQDRFSQFTTSEEFGLGFMHVGRTGEMYLLFTLRDTIVNDWDGFLFIPPTPLVTPLEILSTALLAIIL